MRVIALIALLFTASCQGGPLVTQADRDQLENAESDAIDALRRVALLEQRVEQLEHDLQSMDSDRRRLLLERGY